MELKEMIYRRKSVRSYTGEPVDESILQKIRAFTEDIKPLYPDIRVRSEIVKKENVLCILPWIPPQLVAIYTEEKDGALENVGFIFQQLDLYLQSIGLGACWLGMGKLSPQGEVEYKGGDGLKCVMLLAFGYPKGEALRSDISQFRRKSLSEIADEADERLESARLAPSSVNSQPWYFVHEGDVIHAYCAMQGFLKVRMLSDMNRIDMGIAFAHLCVEHGEIFRFFKAEDVKKLKGYGYIESFILR